LFEGESWACARHSAIRSISRLTGEPDQLPSAVFFNGVESG
jgi:hypothetical protein